MKGRVDGKLNASLAGNLVKPAVMATRYGLRPLYMIEFPPLPPPPALKHKAV